MTEPKPESTPSPSSSTPDTTATRPWWLKALLALLGGVAAWLLLIQPGYQISQVEPPADARAKEQSPLPPKGFLHRIETYQKASRSLLRPMAQYKLKSAVTYYITPRRIERTFQGSLKSTSLAQWQARYQRWHHVLRGLERLAPQLHVEAYRTYLYLQAGMFDVVLGIARKQPQTPPSGRLEAMHRLWLAHAAFWCGEFALARRLYDGFFEALDKHPRWDQRAPHNWRLPSEISTSLYHRGLLALLHQKPTDALAAFGRLERRWAQLRKQSQHSPGVYFARLLAAEAAWQAKDSKTSRRWLKRAATFTKDNTLQMWLEAHYSHKTYRRTKAPDQAHHSRQLWQSLAARMRRHPHSYYDTQALAQLKIAALDLEQGRHSAAITRLKTLLHLIYQRPQPATLSVLLARKTFPFRFLPAPPSVFADLARRLKPLQRPASNTKKTPTPRAPTQPQPSPRPRPGPSSQPTPQPARAGSQGQSASRPMGPPRPASRPAPAKQAATRPSASYTAPRKAFGWRVLELRVALRLMEALAHIKWSDWDAAQRVLAAVLKEFEGQTPLARQAHLYLGMLATARRKFRTASRHLTLYYRAYPNDLRGRVYLGHALWMRRRFQDARRLLLPLRASKRWRRTIDRLVPSKKTRQGWKKMRQQAGFWWRLLGINGWLTLRDPQLSRRALFWAQYPYLRRSASAQQLFHALRTSHLRGRFGLLTLLIRHRLQAQLASQRPGGATRHAPAIRAAQQRWRRLLRLYQQMPHLSYVLDRALYSHKWGTFALGFF